MPAFPAYHNGSRAPHQAKFDSWRHFQLPGSEARSQASEEEHHKAARKKQAVTVDSHSSDASPWTRDARRGSADSAHSTQDLSIFRQEGDYWTLAYHGTLCRLRQIRGLGYIVHLLRHPNREFHVLDLVHEDGGREVPRRRSGTEVASLTLQASGLGDAGEVLDSQARAAYKHRLAELRGELAEAHTYNDPEHAAQAQQEIEFLTHELAAAIGLGGRHRKAASQAERARINVTKGIKAALSKIAAHSPALARYLAITIKTGLFCSFTPDPCLPVHWQF
jgi:hypothetical protein